MNEEQKYSSKARALFILSLGRNWSWINLPAKIDREIKTYLDEYNKMSNKDELKWLHQFLENQGINYIVLESKDQPTNYLKELSKLVYKNDSIMILSI